MPHYVRAGRIAKDDGDLHCGRARATAFGEGVCATDPGAISARVLRHAGCVDVKVGVEDRLNDALARSRPAQRRS